MSALSRGVPPSFPYLSCIDLSGLFSEDLLHASKPLHLHLLRHVVTQAACSRGLITHAVGREMYSPSKRSDRCAGCGDLYLVSKFIYEIVTCMQT